jgi:hypothetical protein
MMGTKYFLQAEAAIASKLLSGKCSVDMQKVSWLFFLGLICLWYLTKQANYEMYVNLF